MYLVPKSKFLLFSGIWDANTEQAGSEKKTSARPTMMRWWMLLVLTAWGFGNILHVHTSPDIITYLMLKSQLKFKSVCLASWNTDVSQATFAPLGLVNVILGWWFAQVKGRGCTPGAWWIYSCQCCVSKTFQDFRRKHRVATEWKCASSCTFSRIQRCRRHKKKNVCLPEK